MVGRWKAAYLHKGDQAFSPQRPTAQELSVPRQLHELERLCGRLSLENELLKKALGKTRLPSPSGMP